MPNIRLAILVLSLLGCIAAVLVAYYSTPLTIAISAVSGALFYMAIMPLEDVDDETDEPDNN